MYKGYMVLGATGTSMVAMALGHFFVVPRIRNNIIPALERDLEDELPSLVEPEIAQNDNAQDKDGYQSLEDESELDQAKQVFKYLLVFVAALESFAHGANDTANATGALSAVVGSYQSGLYDCADDETPWYIMFGAGFFVFLGMFTFGRRVIETIGTEISVIDFHRGYCIEFASTTTVVVATLLNFPVSTTHCQVGAVVFVGFIALGKKQVSWDLFGRIVLTWAVTLPLAGGTAMIFLSLMKSVYAI